MIANVQIRDQPHYRRDSFLTGLKRAGYTLSHSTRPQSKQDVLVTWNRYGNFESIANAWELAGGSTYIAENGYTDVKDEHGRQHYAIAIGGHNGSGRYGEPEAGRFEKLGIELKPWRKTGEHVVICAQRGIGSKAMASPVNWAEKARARLATATKRELRVRAHPGNHAPIVPLEKDLAGAWACAIWTSSAGVKALISGIPVVFDGPRWIAEACGVRLSDIENPVCDDVKRMQAMERMANAQWSVDEIASGKPFALFRERLN